MSNGKRGPDRIPALHMTINCNGCGVPVDVLTNRFNKSKHKKFYHSRDCYFKLVRAESIKLITINCTGCGIPITRYKSEYRNSKTKRFYHDKECFLKFSGYNDQRVGSRYLDSHRCRCCGKFVEISQAILYETKNKERHYLTCPDPTCKKYPLQKRPRSSKRYEKMRKQQKQKQIIPVLQNMK